MLCSSKSQSLYRGRARNFSKFRGLYPGRELYMTTRTSKSRAYTGGQSRNFSETLSLYGGKLGIFSSPRACIEEKNSDFSESQGLYIGRKLYTTTRLAWCFAQGVKLGICPSSQRSTHFFVLPTYFLRFSPYPFGMKTTDPECLKVISREVLELWTATVIAKKKL